MNHQKTDTLSKPKILPVNGNRPFVDKLSADIKCNSKDAEEKKSSEIFYEPVYNKDSKVTDIRIKYRDFTDLLKLLGFVLYDDCKPFTYVRICDNVIEEYSISKIQQFFLDYIKNEHQPLEGVTRDMIIEKLHRSNTNLFSDSRLSFLYPDKPIQFNADTDKESFLYFSNGFVRCSAEGVELLDYKHLSGAIWKKQKIDRTFTLVDWDQTFDSEEKRIDNFGYFAKFMYRVVGSRVDRFWSLCSIAGYLQHIYFLCKLKAIILTDSKISEMADGRTGKTLFCQGLGKVRDYAEINGKDFDPANKHKYQTADMASQIICLNDVRRNFQPESVFNDVTEGLQVEKKNKQPFKIRAKMIISANKTLNIEGASAKDRFLEFEFADHYSNLFGPADEFGHWFFKDWETDEWNRFDNFMAFCICYFLKHGLVEPVQINLVKRKLVDSTSMDFVEFLDEKFIAGELRWNQEFTKEEVYNDFVKLNPDYLGNKRFSSDRNFLKFLRQYCEVCGGKYTSGRSSGIRWVHFGKDVENEI